MRPVTLFTLALSVSSAFAKKSGTCKAKKRGSFPSCALGCFTTAQNQTTDCPSDTVDLACLCSNSEIQTQIFTCLDSSCNTTDTEPGAQYGKDLCAAAINSTSTSSAAVPSATAPPVDPSSSSSEVTGSMTILPIDDSASSSMAPPAASSAPPEDPVDDQVDAVQDEIPSATSSDTPPTTLAALAQANNDPEVVTKTTIASSDPSGAGSNLAAEPKNGGAIADAVPQSGMMLAVVMGVLSYTTLLN